MRHLIPSSYCIINWLLRITMLLYTIRLTLLFGLILTGHCSLLAQVTWDDGAGDGLWSSPLNWSTNAVPGNNDDVQIIGNFTVTVSSSDSCRSLILQSEDLNSRNVTLNITSGARLGIGGTVIVNDRDRTDNDARIVVSGGSSLITGGDFSMIKNGSAQVGNDMVLTLNDDQSLVRIGGDLYLTFSSGVDNTERGLVLNQNSRLEATNIFVSLNGINQSDNLVTLNQSGVAGDSAVVMISNNVRITNSSLTYDCVFDLDFESRFEIGNDLIYGSLGRNLHFSLDRDAQLAVSNDIDITKGGDGDVLISLNENNAGSAADAQMTVGGNLMINKNDGDATTISFRQDADLVVAGDFELSVSNTDDDDDDLSITLRNQSGIDIGQDFLITYDETTRNPELRVSTYNDATLDVDRDLIVTLNDANLSYFRINDNATWTVGRNFTFSNSPLSLYMTLDLDDNGTFNVGNDVSITNPTTINSPTAINILIDGDAIWNVTGNLTLNQTGNDHLNVFLNNSINGTAADAQLTVGGDLTVNKVNGDHFRLYLRDGSTLHVLGDLDIDYGDTEGTNDEFAIEMYNTSSVLIDGSADIFYNNNFAGAVLDFRFEMEDTTRFIVGPIGGPYNTESFTIQSRAGSDTEIELDDTAFIQVNGDFNLLKNGAANFDVILNRFSGSGAEIEVHGDLDLNNGEDADRLFIQLHENAILDVANNIDMIDAFSVGKVELELNDSAKIELGGNFLRSASPNNFGILDANDNGTVEYNSSTQTQLFAEDAGAGTDAFDYQHVIINNSFGTAPQVTMEGTAMVHSGITFTNGILASTTTELLRIDDNATSTGANDNSHVDGPVEKVGNDAFSFPTGDQGNWRQIDIGAPASTSAAFRAEYFNDNPNNGGFDTSALGPGVHRTTGCFYWILERTSSTNSVPVSLSWETCQVYNLASVVVGRWDGANWQNEGNGGTTGGIAPAFGTVVSAANVSNFNRAFTLATINALNPLPVELLSFDATLDGDEVLLDWTTASETNNAQFVVERSANGIDFTPILEQPGAGMSTSPLTYQDIDRNPLIGQSYYRLRQIDFDGQSELSSAVSIFYQALAGAPSVDVYPNPSEGRSISLKLSGFPADQPVLCEVRDVSGRPVVQQRLLTNAQGHGHSMINLEQALAAGLYLISATQGEHTVSTRLIVR